MNDKEIQTIIADIQASPKESEWVEVKENNYNPETIGEYVSALANGAAYMGQSKGYLAFGINDITHAIVGTTFSPKNEKIGNQEIENWIATQLSPRIDFILQEIVVNNKRVVLFVIDSAGNTPVKFKGTAWIRVGSYKKKLADHPERERKIWQNTHNSTFETKIALNGINADEVLKVIDYPAAFRLLNIPLPDNRTGILEKKSLTNGQQVMM
jgi:predicted HTH transcriptional regulator